MQRVEMTNRNDHLLFPPQTRNYCWTCPQETAQRCLSLQSTDECPYPTSMGGQLTPNPQQAKERIQNMNTLVNPTPRMKLCRQPVSNLLVLLKDTEPMFSWVPTQCSGRLRQPTQTESCNSQSHQGTTNIFNEQHTFGIKVNHHP